jgi:rod shape-determining protein MreD
MSWLGLSIIGAVLMVLDVSLGGLLSLGPIRPSLALPFVVYIGLQRGQVAGTVFGTAIGLALDLVGALPLGASSFAYAVVGFACGKLWGEGTFRLVWPWGAFLLLSSIFVEAVAHYLTARGMGLDFLPLYLRSGLPAAIYTTVLGLLWFLSPLHRVRPT